MPLIVVIDTNFLTVPAQFGIDIFSEAERILERRVEYVLLSTAESELNQKLEMAPTTTEKRKFLIAKELIDRCRVVNVDETTSKLPVDDQLLEYTISVKGVLATNDKELRTRARNRRIPVLIMRGKKKLELVGTVI
ncbi:MAG: type II toxin-antitoxin system VapC family toxin [Candidatus Thorarchaeota archaeon]